jgi:hypothetical protein
MNKKLIFKTTNFYKGQGNVGKVTLALYVCVYPHMHTYTCVYIYTNLK